MADTKPQAPARQPVASNKNTPPPKSKRERFQGLLPKRMTAAIKALDRVARCGNRTSYEYTDQEAARIAEDLTVAVTRVRGAYRGQEEKKTLWRL